MSRLQVALTIAGVALVLAGWAIFAYMVGGFATLTILMKNSLMENLGQDYVRTAFAKGLTERRVVAVHALRNSLIPIVTGLGNALTLVLAGSYLIEKTFDIDGMGLLGYNAALKRDYMVMMGIIVISVIVQLLPVSSRSSPGAGPAPKILPSRR